MPNKKSPNQTDSVEISISTLKKIYESFQEDGQTIVHCSYVSKRKYVNGGWVNIYPTTFLMYYDEMLPLLHAENIPLGPGKHMFNKPGELKQFTLIFPPVPNGWEYFNLVEECPSTDGFVVTNIKRNNSGVYEVMLH